MATELSCWCKKPKILTGNPGYLIASMGIHPLEVPDPSADRSLGDVHPWEIRISC